MSPDIRGFELPWPRRAEKSRDGIFLLASPSGCGFPPRGRTFPWPSFHIRAHAPILSLFPALFRPYLGLKQVNANRQEFFKVLYIRCFACIERPNNRCTYGKCVVCWTLTALGPGPGAGFSCARQHFRKSCAAPISLLVGRRQCPLAIRPVAVATWGCSLSIKYRFFLDALHGPLHRNM